MKISAVEEYGLRCMVQLARSEGQGSLAVSELARLEGLSVPYVGKLMARLRRGGLAVSARGSSGGYSLCRPANQIAVSQVLATLADPLYSSSFCKEHKGNADRCVHVLDCSIRTLWREVQSAVRGVLESVTLKDLARGERALAARFEEDRGQREAKPLAETAACGVVGCGCAAGAEPLPQPLQGLSESVEGL